MEARTFGTTDLRVSVIGFGAWAIGGPAVVGSTAIGWGDADDDVSRRALRRALDLGITFYDTADFYGLGRSESLIGEVFGNSDNVVVATKVGHRPSPEGKVLLDYSKKHVLAACEESLRRLRRDTIDLYQLHSARVAHLEDGECLSALEQLKQEGKIRWWGLSLNTFAPQPEAELLLDRGLGYGFQLVANVLNRTGFGVIERARAKGMGIIARMPLQFGLLAGTIAPDRRFPPTDHRSFRLTEEIITRTRTLLGPLWKDALASGLSAAAVALSYAASLPGVSTVIPGIRTPLQAEANAAGIVELPPAVRDRLEELSEDERNAIVELMRLRG